MQLFLCETKSMQENFKYEKPQQIDIIENAEDGKGKRSTSTSEQQRKHPVLIKIAALVCSSTFSANQRTEEVKWKKKQKEKTQKTGGQMKTYEGSVHQNRSFNVFVHLLC